MVSGREDSFEWFQEIAVQFAEESSWVQNHILQKLQFERLYKAILTRSKEEQWLIHELYFEEQTEREVAKQMRVYHNAVHKQKKKILEKLKKILEKI